MTNQTEPNDRPNPAVLHTMIFAAVSIITFFGLKMLLPPAAITVLYQLGPAKALLGYAAAVGVATLATAVVWRLMQPKRKGQPRGADLSN